MLLKDMKMVSLLFDNKPQKFRNGRDLRCQYTTLSLK